MGDLDAAVCCWVDMADYDLKTAQAMLVTERYLYVGFMCHQTIEELLKAYYARTIKDAPPYTRNLSRLANLSSAYGELSESQQDFLDIIEPLNTEARYPKEKDTILKSLTREKCELLISAAKELSAWMKSQLP
ncbi:MAG: HEPN domain-containing protein [Clostridia bacterium]|nr:HEPN domain-containing protein [Clostridia bacterium]